MKVERINHIAIRVKDAKKAIKLFGDLFETDFTYFDDFPETGARSYIEPMGLEIVEPLTPDGLLANTIEKRGEGLTLITLKVQNLDQAVTEMKARGIRQIMKFERNNWRSVMFHTADTFGVMIELIEYKTKHPILVTAIK